MTTRNEILQKLKELKPYLMNEYEVKSIGLFGSFANNTQQENSDIDLIVEIKKPVGWKFFSLEIYLEKSFNRKVDLVSKNSLKAQIKNSIINSVIYI